VPSSPKINRQKVLTRKVTGRDSNFLGNGTPRDAIEFVGGNLQRSAKVAADVFSKSRTANPNELAAKYGQQFASKAIKRTIDDVQGIAKTLLKGFGN